MKDSGEDKDIYPVAEDKSPVMFPGWWHEKTKWLPGRIAAQVRVTPNWSPPFRTRTLPYSTIYDDKSTSPSLTSPGGGIESAKRKQRIKKQNGGIVL